MYTYKCHYKVMIILSMLFTLMMVNNKGYGSTYYSNIECFSVSHGLPDNTIYSIKKDNTGFIWLGTPKGLTRFDGNKFNVYSSKSNQGITLQHDGASNIFIDSKQQFWIGTWAKGLALYDPVLKLIKNFQHDKKDPTSLCSNKVQSFFEDSQNTLWLGTSNGLCRYNKKRQTFTSFNNIKNNNHSLSHNRVWQIVEAQGGILWIATSHGLNKMSLNKPGYFTRYTYDKNDPNSIFHPQVRTLLVDKNNTLWIGTERGFGRYNENKDNFTFITPKQQQLNVPITNITAGKFNDIWVATHQGLYRYLPHKKKFSLLENKKIQIFSHDDIRDIIIGKNDVIWIATRYAGLLKVNYSANSFNLINQYTTKSGAKDKFHHVTAFLEDHNNVLWISTDEGLLFRDKNNNSFSLFKTIKAIGPYRVDSLVEDAKQQIWVAGGSGLFVINPQRTKMVNMNHLIKKLKNTGIKKLLYDKKQQLWCVSYFEGLVKITPNTTVYYQHDENNVTSLADNELADIIEDRSGQIWVATNTKGLDKIDHNLQFFIHYPISSDSSSHSEQINTLYQSQNNQFYVGTQNGLYVLNPVTNNFELVQNNVSFQSNNIKSIIEDEYDGLWLTTSAGISLYKQGQYSLNFDKKEGVPSNDFLKRSILKLTNNNLLFGADNGITMLSTPLQQQTNKHAETIITAVTINQIPLSQYQFSPHKPLWLNYHTNTVKINFAYLNYNKNTARHYQYYLKNYDRNKYQTTKKHSITYHNLPSGRYVFFVVGTDAFQTVKYQQAKLVFIIESPWWQLWWLQVIAIILSLILVILIVKIRTQKLAKQKHDLEIIVKERSKKLLEAQKKLVDSEKNIALSSLVTGVAHEINTPLGIGVTAASYIVDIIDELLESYQNKTINHKGFKDKTDRIKQGADIILRNLTRASELISSFKLVAVDQSNEEQRPFNIDDYLHNILTSLSPNLKKQSVHVEVDCPKNITVISYPGAFAQIVTNIILNALIHAFEDCEQRKITITIGYHKSCLTMDICDNGNGIASEKISQIFDPFFTTKRGQGGSGLGLHIVQNITTQTFKGKINCTSKPHQGCCFHLTLLLPSAN